MNDNPLFTTDEEAKKNSTQVNPVAQAAEAADAAVNTPSDQPATVTTPEPELTGRDLNKYVKVVTSLTDGNVDHNVDMLQKPFIGSLSKALQAMPEDLRAAIQVEQAGRSRAYQTRLYQRHKLGGPLAAPPGHSRHETGNAVDIGPTSGTERDPKFQAALNWLYQNGEAYGILNPPSIRNRDSGHFQWVGQPKVAGPDKSLRTNTIPYEVKNAIELTAHKYGLDRRMLYSIAYGESTYGIAPPSSVGATGLFQMTAETWGDLVKRNGKNFPEITNWDRNNPLHNALMMGAFTRENQAILHEKLGRDPTPGEVYGAHFLGASGYSRFVDYAKNNPHAPAADGVGAKSVAANKTVFFRKDGVARTAEEVQMWMDRKASTAPGFNDDNEKVKALIDKSQEGYKSIPGVGEAVALSEGKVSEATAGANLALAAQVENARRNSRKNASQNGVAAEPNLGVGYKKIDLEDIYAPPSINSRDISKKIEEQMNHREEVASLSTLALDAFRDTQTLSWMFAGAPGMRPDPNYMMTEEMAKKLIEGVDPRYHSWIINSYSEAQAGKAREDALAFQAGEKRLDEAGITGTALRIASSFLDPVTLGVAIGTEGLAAPLVFGKTAQSVGKLKAGLLASAGNVAATGVLQVAGDPRITGQDYVLAGVAGFGLGALFGRSGRVLAENEKLADQAASVVDDIVKAKQGSSSAGAAQNLDAPYVSPQLEANWDRLKNEDVWESPVWDKLPLWGTVDKTLQSKNPAARLVAPYLAENAVGFKGHGVVPVAASERGKRLEGSFDARYTDHHRTHYEEYLKEAGGNWVDKWRLTGEFADKVGLAIRERDPAVRAKMSPAAVKMADRQIALQDELLELEKNPGAWMGKEMQSVQGFNDVVNKGSYLMRVWDNAKLKTLGLPKLQRMLRGAIRAEQPDLEEAYVRRLADGAAEKMMDRTHGLDDYFERAMTGADEESLKRVLREFDFVEEEMDEVLSKFKQAKEADAKNPARSKRRMILNETYETEIDGQKYKLSDFLVNDGPALFKARNRQATSRIALAQVQIHDPKTGELLVDGIRSDADFEKLITQVKTRGGKEGQTPRQIASDEAQLRFIYDYMTGRLKMPDSKLMDALRLVQKFNFSRVMNQVGFAQIPEMATTVAQLGIRASMEHMPEFRRILGMKASHLERHGTLDEFQAFTGQSTAMLRSHITSRFDDEATNGFHKYTKGSMFDKAEAGMENLNRATSTLSGMNGITDMMQNWNAKIVGQTFVNLAHGAKEVDGKLVFSHANIRRIKSLGIETEKTSKFRYKNPKYKGVDMRKAKEEYDAVVKSAKADAASKLSPEDKKLLEVANIRLKEMEFNNSIGRDVDLPDIEAVTKQIDELLAKGGYTLPKAPGFKGEAKWIEGEGTMLERITRQIKEHATTEKGIYNDKKFQLMNYNSWTDLEAREAFIDSLFRASRRMVQENDVGQMATWMSNPMVRVLLQFRTFMVAGFSKQLLHNLHMSGAMGGGFDRQNASQAFGYFTASVVMGGLAYAMQMKLQAAGRSDADEWLYDEKKGKLTHENLAKAAVQRAGWSSIIPLVMDSAKVGQMLTGDPLFDARTTGQSSDLIFGNPTVGLLDQVTSLGPSIGNMIREDRSPTQAELRKAFSLLPFQNLMGVQQTFNYMISGFDETKPR
ncbi:D-alanyl-D-alanine carboxypeptidase family protein [Hyphomicrobium sp. ghe19]|uniref:D-alanyl-D-alanine carboxypeptidase family protein n=1 Tax=Hyphomicrobium sp. ghe19 TaxID=2682968 RepID=UPI001366AF9B|nr:hypothetical protein HYPP_02633 [Hyphomicrobium sp. ghe19]